MTESQAIVVARIDERLKALQEASIEDRKAVFSLLAAIRGQVETNTLDIDRQKTMIKTHTWWVGMMAAIVASVTYAVIPVILEKVRFQGTADAAQIYSKLVEPSH